MVSLPPGISTSIHIDRAPRWTTCHPFDMPVMDSTFAGQLVLPRHRRKM